MTPFPTLRSYRRAWLRLDVLAGLAAGAVVIPQAMAYASIAGLPAQVGLYTCMIPMLVYALLGGSGVLSVSTTSTVAVLTAATLAAAGSTGSTAAVATLTVEVGLVLLAGWALRLGSLVENISEAVLIGVKTGVGLVVAVGQLPVLMGFSPSGDGGFFAQLADVLRHFGDANPATVALSAALLAILIGARVLVPRLPAPLLAVAVAIVAVVVLDLPDRGVALIDPVPQGLPAPRLPGLDHAAALLPGAIAIALMVFMESLSVARAMHHSGQPPLDNNRELAAAGLACTAGGIFGAMPAAGGFSQTAVNARAGAKTQASQLVTAGLAVAVAWWLAPILDDLPRAALAAMVIVAVLGLIQPAEFARLARINRAELWIAVATTIVGLTAGLLAAVTVGVLSTLVLVLHELNKVRMVQVHAGHVPSGVLVLRPSAPLYTANVRAAQRRVLEQATAAPDPPQVIILDAEPLGALSVTVLDAIRELDQQLSGGGTQLWIAGLPARATITAQRTRWFPEWQAQGRVWPDTTTAVTAATHRHQAR